MSDDPVRNGISRLDEMMSGAVRSTLRSISLMVAYTLLYLLSFIVLQMSVCLLGVQVVVYLERRVVLSEYFRAIMCS